MRLGLDISAHHASCIVADAGGASLCALRAPLPQEGGTPAIWAAAMDTARDAMRRSLVQPAQIESAGLSFDALLSDEGVVLVGRNTDGWAGYNLPAALREHLGIARATVENRAVCEALGELTYGALNRWFRKGDGPLHWIYLHLGAAVGGTAGDGTCLRRGARGAWHDFGSICIDRDGPVSASGRRGSLDAYCGGEAFIARAASYGMTLKTAGEVFGAGANNFAAKSLCDDYIRRLAQGIGAMVVSEPRAVVIGGGMARGIGARLPQLLNAALPEFCGPPLPKIVPGTLGEDAAVLGAIALATRAPVIPAG